MTLRLTVVIPTYKRPDWIARAHASLLSQSEPPERIHVVCRDTDADSKAVVEQLMAQSEVLTTTNTVSVPGHIPPVERGSHDTMMDSDLVAWLDDDAEANPKWCENFRREFSKDKNLGALGGRVINHDENEVPVPEKDAEVFGQIDWRGVPIGNLYRPGAPGVIESDLFMGGNVCFRSQAIEGVRFDYALNKNVAFHYELDVAMQIKSKGWTIKYDPQNPIDHFSAPRALAGMRDAPSEGIRASSRNITRIRMKRMEGVRRALALTSQSLVGGRRDPGWLTVLPLCAQERALDPIRRFAFATGGRAEAYLNYAKERTGLLSVEQGKES